MGGENSGRRPDVIKMAKEQFDKGFIEFKGEAPWVEIPNYSGLKPAVLKTSPAAIFGSHGADGAVQFAKDGGFLSDNTNFHWDDTNNRLGIGTASPDFQLELESTAPALSLKNTGTTNSRIISDTNPTAAGTTLSRYMTNWNGTTVTEIRSVAGDDTTNKDDGELTFL